MANVSKGKTAPDATELEESVLAFIEAHRLFSPRETVVVAVSGGPDSICLLYTLLALQERLGIRLYVAHLNHQLRGHESDEDAEYVTAVAREVGIPATISSRDVQEHRAQHHQSLEEAAREVRYGFLAEVARACGASKIALGHTRDDHVETILMHLVRGSGTRGLRGLVPLTSLRTAAGSAVIVRPLLEITRAETQRYCEQRGLRPRLDSSNLSLSPLRNRIRQKLLPLLRSYNPGISRALQRTSHIAAADMDYLDKTARRILTRISVQEGGSLSLNRKAFNRLYPVMQRYVLPAALESLCGDIRDIEMRHIDKVLLALEKPAGRRLELPGGIMFAIEHDAFIFSNSRTRLCVPALDGEYPLNIPGQTKLPGWRVTAALLSKMPGNKTNESTAYLDAELTGDYIIVRSLHPGDRFQPLGLAQTKKLGRFMIDAHIPRSQRCNIPIVCAPRGIIWVVGWRLDERFKVTDETRRVLRLQFEKLA